MAKIQISFEFPYDIKLSKNEWHVFTGATKNQWDGLPGVPVEKRRSAVVNTATATALMGGVERLARGQCVLLKRNHDREFEPRKIWVRVMVYRPDMRGDPVNFLGMLCDGIKRGIRVDDNVFSGSWDWELVTDGSERIEIIVEQELKE